MRKITLPGMEKLPKTPPKSRLPKGTGDKEKKAMENFMFKSMDTMEKPKKEKKTTKKSTKPNKSKKKGGK